jgi:hypothetical protein
MTNFGTSVRPQDVNLAFWLWIASLLVAITATLIAIPTMGETAQLAAQQQAAARGTSLSPDAAASMVHLVVVSSIVGSVVGFALNVFFAVKMRAGRNWARIVITVFAVIGVLFTVLGLKSGLTLALQIVAALLYIATVVLMFRPAAKAYFATARPAQG